MSRWGRTIPGKEMGVFARLDANGRELVYIGIENLVMHKDVLDRINAKWDEHLDDQNVKAGSTLRIKLPEN